MQYRLTMFINGGINLLQKMFCSALFLVMSLCVIDNQLFVQVLHRTLAPGGSDTVYLNVRVHFASDTTFSW